MKNARVVLVLLGTVLLGGCAAADAGKATTSVTVTFPGAMFDNGAVVTITNTITPTSSASQTPTNTTDVPVTIPASVIPGR